MKKRLFISLLLCCSALLSMNTEAKQNEQSLDKIVAIINDDVVTKSELNRALASAKLQIEQEHLPTPSEDVLHKQVLDQLVNKKLQLQIAKQVGINITDADLEQTIQHVADSNNMSVSDLYQRLNQEGLSSTDYRDEMRDQLTMQKLQQQEVIGHLMVSPQEVTSFMHSQTWQTNGNNEYHLQDILIPLSDTPSPEEIATAKRRAEALVAKIHSGLDFNKIAQSESGDKNALQGGDLGWRKLPEIPSAFAEKVVHMKAKELAGPIQTPNGFHIIRVAELRASDNAVAAPDRKQVEQLLLQRKFEEAVQSWVSRLRSQAFINLNPEKENA